MAYPVKPMGFGLGGLNLSQGGNVNWPDNFHMYSALCSALVEKTGSLYPKGDVGLWKTWLGDETSGTRTRPLEHNSSTTRRMENGLTHAQNWLSYLHDAGGLSRP